MASMPVYNHRQYQPTRFYRETNSAFVFFSACPELQAKDFAPGGFFVYVDKSDGHIWNQSEIEKTVKQPNQEGILQAA